MPGCRAGMSVYLVAWGGAAVFMNENVLQQNASGAEPAGLRTWPGFTFSSEAPLLWPSCSLCIAGERHIINQCVDCMKMNGTNLSSFINWILCKFRVSLEPTTVSVMGMMWSIMTSLSTPLIFYPILYVSDSPPPSSNDVMYQVFPITLIHLFSFWLTHCKQPVSNSI